MLNPTFTATKSGLDRGTWSSSESPRKQQERLAGILG